MNTVSRFVVLLAVVGLAAWCFADALFYDGMFAFRDAAHFYYPLFQFIQSEWSVGRVPLCSPYENLGMPLAANPAASVFYPGKLIFFLPIDYGWAYKSYILAHVVLAAAGAYWLARGWKAGARAAGVCAISYAFSGSVLMQYTNVIFLVGAAWLPFGVLTAERMLHRRSPRWAVLLGTVLALMTLGGDPQMAYNLGLLAAFYAVWLWWDRRRVRRAVGGPEGRQTWWNTRPALLALAATIGVGLSAVQVLPSLELASRSERSGNGWNERLSCSSDQSDGHTEHVYHFSVGPWRLAEYVWPNVAGRQFPVHRRWLEIIPAEGRIWTPSLYMGLLPLLLAANAMRLRRGRTRVKWISWTVVLAVIASFGWYGLGWLVHEVRMGCGAAPEDWLIAAPVGGVYWLMTLVLPGYGWFRYPAKLLVVAALGLSVLAARGWDRTLTRPSTRLRRGLLWLGGVSLLAAAVVLAVQPCWHGWLAGVEPDPLFGPLDTHGAATDLVMSLLQTAVICALGWWLLCRASDGARWVAPAMVLLVAVDLAAANGWMIACAPADSWQGESKLAVAIRRDSSHRQGTKDATASGPIRVWRHPIWFPAEWKTQGSVDRLAEAVCWDRDSLWPKYNLAFGIRVTEVHDTIMPREYEALLAEPNGAYSSLACRTAQYAILPEGEVLPGGEPLRVDLRGVGLWYHPDHLEGAREADSKVTDCPGGRWSFLAGGLISACAWLGSVAWWVCIKWSNHGWASRQ